MNDFIMKKLASLEVLTALKKSRMLNPVTGKILLSAYSQNDSAQLTNLLKTTELVSQMLKSSPFPIPNDSVDGLIRIGKTEDNMPVGLDFSKNSAHTLVCGSPSTGKSTMFKWLCLQIIAYNKFIEENF